MDTDTTPDSTETFEVETDDINVEIELEAPTKTGVIVGALAAAAVVPLAYFGTRAGYRTIKNKIADHKAKKNPASEAVIETTGSETIKDLETETVD